MKHTYRIRVQPHYYGVQPLTEERLTGSIEGLVIRELLADSHRGGLIDVELQRPSHEDALNEILLTLQNLGYSWLEASVTEWTDNALGGLLLGSGACGTAGFSSGDASVGLVLTLLGGLVGTVIGSFIESAKVVYELQWTGDRYQLVQLRPAPAVTHGVQPRLA